jgi:hypothetical protein
MDPEAKTTIRPENHSPSEMGRMKDATIKPEGDEAADLEDATQETEILLRRERHGGDAEHHGRGDHAGLND